MGKTLTACHRWLWERGSSQEVCPHKDCTRALVTIRQSIDLALRVVSAYHAIRCPGMQDLYAVVLLLSLQPFSAIL